ncbi:tRNA (guanosine(37)-N1)-methyltransferase TrmD [Peribacillus butanolivorans]|uniref:tRNA (guanine-N(1)-)-methyltransferase n=1 Tax=Peribacillus butanolivorans TaxID=421767 RepID=A0AAX0S3Z0_9BACI|nr:tRNA (guanosine(37)-N1)-methyltransferase TrmD [Peribacillus butanolivorans]AXN40517.1 tRNA (guanosine(37)-N1)-methyltransferase TrmD [Peribacillus butanolivorans]PEJ35092.1 tRNA (guanosine(37)-N1)-methyltransferase TrmD [Peribacillus butanolivorans]QNU05599.1 tRNA (guanosine(37)-N1)-methyltransferase TrmD [Peribacillus butanolivorans]
MKIDVLSLFPEMFEGVFGSSILKKAAEKQAVSYNVTNFRDYADNKHSTVDDYPYGGGAGMVLKAQPIFDAVEALKGHVEQTPRVVLLCPQGERYTQRKAEEFAKEDHLIFICGHYEGYDERIREHIVTDEISIGDFVLTGGELGAMVIIDSVVRLLPGVLGNVDSPILDSYSSGLLEHPHYTRPADFRGMKVPDTLISGNHKKIDEWRMKESLRRTWNRRPDLLESYELSDVEKKLLSEIQKED